MEAQPHPRQPERLRALYSYDILDTPRESDYDEVVELVSQICEAPISVVNLIDVDRQWFKAEVGLGVRETPIETSICAHAILEHDFVEIEDTQQDPRLRDNPLCLGDEGLRFYAGALLKTASGLPLGTLCVLDRKPRILTPLQRQAISVLGRQVMRQLDLRQALRDTEILRREVDHRVKNSLQVISAHTRLQRRGVDSEEAQSALAIVQRRIDTLASLHGQIYALGANGSVDLGTLLNTVCALAQDSAPQGVVIKPAVDHVDISPDNAAHIAVIVNECVTNSFKHAYRDGRAGTISIVGREEPGRYTLVCRDDVPAEPGGALPADGASLGLKIIRASASQLGGDADFAHGPDGYGVTVTFPVE